MVNEQTRPTRPVKRIPGEAGGNRVIRLMMTGMETTGQRQSALDYSKGAGTIFTGP